MTFRHAVLYSSRLLFSLGAAILMLPDNPQSSVSETRHADLDAACLHAAAVSLKRANSKGQMQNSEQNLYQQMLAIAIEEAKQGLAEAGVPIGAAIFKQDGALVSRGHNRRVQENDPSIHGETDAFRRAGRQTSYRDLIMVTTLAPCWYCSGLVRQFHIGTLIVGESRNFQGGVAWLQENGVHVIDLDSQECVDMLSSYIASHPEVWNEDIGEQPAQS
jgi:cytosine deaminase